MNNALIKRMRKAREFQVSVGDYAFTVLRPQEGDAARFNAMSAIELATEYVVDWQGVTEADLVPSGGSDPVPFDRALWAEWCRDRHELWAPITDAISSAIAAHLEKREAAAKN